MDPSIIRAAALRPRPWPNGLGITRDVAEGEGWMIGIADLGAEAAFSHFAGMDRVFTLLGGPGATLEVDGIPLPCRPFVPAHFPGDRPTRYRPEGGPARAFNLFLCRGGAGARVVALGLAAGQGAGCGGDALALFCAAGRLRMGAALLEAGDTLLHPGAGSFAAEGAAAMAILVERGR